MVPTIVPESIVTRGDDNYRFARVAGSQAMVSHSLGLAAGARDVLKVFHSHHEYWEDTDE